ncbi:MAG TPA: AAA family ATPase, partial [Prevotella sp.]
MDIVLVQYMNNQLQNTDLRFHRYRYAEINWQSRMFGLVGPRGVGKTTLLLQYIKEHRQEEPMFYVSADNIYFSTHTLVELADEF